MRNGWPEQTHKWGDDLAARYPDRPSHNGPAPRSRYPQSVTFNGGGVSPILEPPPGTCWFGAATTDAAGTYNYTVGLNEYETSTGGIEPHIQHWYNVNGDTFFNSGDVGRLRRANKRPSLVLYNYKPDSLSTWATIAAGKSASFESNIRTHATAMKKFGQKFFLAIQHEPENDDGGGGLSLQRCADYVAMYRYVVKRLRDLGVWNAITVMNYMSYYGWANWMDLLWPGDDVVDWIGGDPYSFHLGPTWESALNQRHSSVPRWKGFYNWCIEKHPDKPIMLCEWGVPLASAVPSEYQVMFGPEGIHELRTKFSRIRALVYWNENLADTYRIDTNPTFESTMRRFISDPYFQDAPIRAAITA